MKFTSVAILGFASLAFSAPGALDTRQDSIEAVTDHYLFDLTIDQFIAKRNAQDGPAGLDWSSNGCSDSPDNPFGFNFLQSCQRHDFGYQNYKKQNRFDAGKASIDSNFKKDMFNQCETENHKTACKALATLYYEAVKEFGKIASGKS